MYKRPYALLHTLINRISMTDRGRCCDIETKYRMYCNFITYQLLCAALNSNARYRDRKKGSDGYSVNYKALNQLV